MALEGFDWGWVGRAGSGVLLDGNEGLLLAFHQGRRGSESREYFKKRVLHKEKFCLSEQVMCLRSHHSSLNFSKPFRLTTDRYLSLGAPNVSPFQESHIPAIINLSASHVLVKPTTDRYLKWA